MFCIIDASSQFVFLSAVIDTDAECLLASSALGIPETLYRRLGLYRYRLDGLVLVFVAVFDIHRRLRAAIAVNCRRRLRLGTGENVATAAVVVVVVMVIVSFNEEGPRRVWGYIHVEYRLMV